MLVSKDEVPATPFKRGHEITRDRWPRIVPFIALDAEAATKLAVGLPGSPRVAEVFPLPGGLTNSNYKFVFADSRASVEAKLYQGERGPALIERAVHRLGSERKLPLPKLLAGADDNAVTHTPYAIFEWVEGMRLDLAVHAYEAATIVAFGDKLGRALAAIHAIGFETCGFFDGDLNVHRIDLDGSGMLAYFRQVLTSATGRERLSRQVCDGLLAFAQREAPILDTWHGRPCLTHGDCGGTNILVIEEGAGLRLSGIIDWEFAFSGTPFFDLGNLLRPPLGEVPGFAEAVAEGYRGAGGKLPENWRALAAMTDLLAWVESALRVRVSPEFLESARQAIGRTIATWR